MSVVNSTPLLLGDDGYQISRSVRLRSSASAYFNRAAYPVASAGTQWTMSMWVKRGTLGIVNLFSFVGTSGSAQQAGMMFDGNNNLRFWQYAPSTYQFHKITTATFRDPSAWYHVVFVYNTTLATAADRCQIWVNGIRQTSFSTSIDPAQNLVTYFKTGQYYPYIGGENRDNSSVQNPFDGYLTEVNFIDGQALTPSSFGEFDAITGVWKPKKYAGTYGTNGFYLNFSDNSSNTATTIGKDYSGNGNNWTPNNISVTAGATYDSMIDVPTLWADGGNGRGNYAVLNPLWKDSAVVIKNGNLDVSNGNYGGISTIVMPTGSKFYCEVTVTATQGNQAVGLVKASAIGTAISNIGLFASSAYGYYATNGQKYVLGAASAYGSSWGTIGDVIGIAADLSANTLTFYKNNTNQGSITIDASVDYVFGVSNATATGGVAFNFGQRPFTYTPPSGFKALNTLNLPTPTIVEGNQYFDATLYTGNGGAQSIAGVGFQPDLVWTKNRSAVSNQALWDAVRGANALLVSSSTAAEVTNSGNGYLTSFNSDGFSVINGTTSANNVNTSGNAYVAWQWKEGATQGFDIVTYTGNGTSQNIPHNLGVAPKFIITKNRSASSGWLTYHSAVGAGAYLSLASTSASTADASVWNNTTPTSSVFSVGSPVSQNTNNYVAYCFTEVAGYSKFGSYTGNGSADGPFVYCGFMPRYVLVKRTDTTGDWIVYDTARDTYNASKYDLSPNSSAAESPLARLDILSNGWKWRDTSAGRNASGGTYIYMAFAENPFKYSLAR